MSPTASIVSCLLGSGVGHTTLSEQCPVPQQPLDEAKMMTRERFVSLASGRTAGHVEIYHLSGLRGQTANYDVTVKCWLNQYYVWVVGHMCWCVHWMTLLHLVGIFKFLLQFRTLYGNWKFAELWGRLWSLILLFFSVYVRSFSRCGAVCFLSRSDIHAAVVWLQAWRNKHSAGCCYMCSGSNSERYVLIFTVLSSVFV